MRTRNYLTAHVQVSSEATINVLCFVYADEQLIMVCVDLFFTGGDTTSTTLEFAILYMLLNPEIQRKLQEEIDLVVGEETPTLDHKLR